MIRGAEDVLIDSSGWIQFLRRKGDPAAKQRVRELIAGGRAVWCPAIQLELWRGCTSKTDRDELRDLQSEIPSLEMSAEVWEYSFEIAAKCQPRGLVVPPTDLMIFACARVCDIEIYHIDKHFNLLAELA